MDTVVRAAAIYLILLAIVRLSGRRTLAQMTPFDLVLILIVAEAAGQALLADDFSITNAAILIVTLFSLDIVFSYVKRYWPPAGKVLDGVPVILVADGRPDEHALRRSRVDLDDVMHAAREKQGLERLDQVRFAVLEVSGDITIIPK